jgi:DNA-binding MarR family transcriptional regulator
VTASDFESRSDDALPELGSSGNAGMRRIGVTCRSAADGRRAIRALGEWSGRFELSEPEFQVLWCLRSACGDGCDQTTIAKHLFCSPAQVSATVERMRAEGWITQRNVSGDRRRRLWQLSALGQALLGEMLRAADQLRYSVTDTADCAPGANNAKEAA